MHDKELDELFSDKLKRLEMEPDGTVWKGIILELDDVKLKDKFWQVIGMAVIIVSILAGSLYFLLKKNDLNREQPQTNPSTIVDKQDIISLAHKLEKVYRQHHKDKIAYNCCK
ncbi:hypothetical protein [Mucilaginibacter ginkgonis]|uniref:Uncharacterized protein n=1 Tax=Mucilaginibacter ginkgonis TaxID=2682091 RepID=A0A6I4I2P5_9SPHI|nr:hypothetical protein [Mucilaginibacter ginkgonis]QQL49114.1 hypothetical protein GO620_013135 [Mucilaginibacter ginkgonis]